MTEQVFAKANELNSNINILRERKKDLEKVYELLSDVVKQEWEIKTSNNNCSRVAVQISPDSAGLALKAEMERVDKELENLEKEFIELH